jgi:hypothetical protein
VRREERDIKIPDNGQIGTGVPTVEFNGMWLGIEGTFIGSVDVEGLLSADLTVWTTILAGVNAATVVEIKPQFAQVRINGTNLTGLTGGKAKLVGFNQRTQ